MIILDHVSKHYQTRDKQDFVAVEPTSLEIKQGEIFGLMGYSGAGKSTLLRLINLLERPDTGTVSVCGQELTALNATQLRHARQNIGMVFQQFNLLSNRTVAENVAFPLEIAKWPSKKIQARVEEMFGNRRLARPCQPLPVPTFRRSKTTCRHCPRAGAATSSHPRRRTHFRPRPCHYAQRFEVFGRHQPTL